MKNFVYVLGDAKKKWFYKGMTRNLERRLSEHMRGRVRSTRNYLPLRLVFVQVCENRLEARRLEKYLKSGGGREIIKEIGFLPWWRNW